MAMSSTCSSSCRLSFFRPTWNFTNGSSSSRVWPATEDTQHIITVCAERRTSSIPYHRRKGPLGNFTIHLNYEYFILPVGIFSDFFFLACCAFLLISKFEFGSVCTPSLRGICFYVDLLMKSHTSTDQKFSLIMTVPPFAHVYDWGCVLNLNAF